MSEKKKKVCIIRSNPVNPDSRVEKEALSLKRFGYLCKAWHAFCCLHQSEILSGQEARGLLCGRGLHDRSNHHTDRQCCGSNQGC